MENDLKDNLNVKIEADEYLDCKELRCPMPIVKLSKAMKSMTSGQTIVVEATDLAFKSDVEAWVRTMDYELLDFIEGPVSTVVIRKS